MLMALAAMLLLPVPADAQLKGLLKKAKKTVEQAVTAATEAPAGNPLADMADIKLLYISGDTVSAHYGRAMLVLSVNMKADKPQIRIGSVNNTRMMAVTPDGKTYMPALNLNGVYPKDVAQGTAVTIPLNDSELIINDIPLGTSMFQTVKLGIMIDPQHKETLTFHNVPIKWEHNSNPDK